VVAAARCGKATIQCMPLLQTWVGTAGVLHSMVVLHTPPSVSDEQLQCAVCLYTTALSIPLQPQCNCRCTNALALQRRCTNCRAHDTVLYCCSARAALCSSSAQQRLSAANATRCCCSTQQLPASILGRCCGCSAAGSRCTTHLVISLASCLTVISTAGLEVHSKSLQ
jgi:hypothetical protein